MEIGNDHLHASNSNCYSNFPNVKLQRNIWKMRKRNISWVKAQSNFICPVQFHDICISYSLPAYSDKTSSTDKWLLAKGFKPPFGGSNAWLNSNRYKSRITSSSYLRTSTNAVSVVVSFRSSNSRAKCNFSCYYFSYLCLYRFNILWHEIKM